MLPMSGSLLTLAENSPRTGLEPFPALAVIVADALDPLQSIFMSSRTSSSRFRLRVSGENLPPMKSFPSVVRPALTPLLPKSPERYSSGMAPVTAKRKPTAPIDSSLEWSRSAPARTDIWKLPLPAFIWWVRSWRSWPRPPWVISMRPSLSCQSIIGVVQISGAIQGRVT